jgi:GNAT superfamily N-acetyltransferase
MEIRKAKANELQKCGDCAREFYASSEHLTGFDIGRFSASWKALIESETGVMFLLLDEGTVRGAIGGVAFPDINSGTLISQEFFWFVSSSARGSYGVRLYKAFEAWSRERGCAQIRMGHLLDLMPEKVSAFYRAMGFRPIETNYAKELP